VDLIFPFLLRQRSSPASVPFFRSDRDRRARPLFFLFESEMFLGYCSIFFPFSRFICRSTRMAAHRPSLQPPFPLPREKPKDSRCLVFPPPLRSRHIHYGCLSLSFPHKIRGARSRQPHSLNCSLSPLPFSDQLIDEQPIGCSLPFFLFPCAPCSRSLSQKPKVGCLFFFPPSSEGFKQEVQEEVSLSLSLLSAEQNHSPLSPNINLLPPFFSFSSYKGKIDLISSSPPPPFVPSMPPPHFRLSLRNRWRSRIRFPFLFSCPCRIRPLQVTEEFFLPPSEGRVKDWTGRDSFPPLPLLRLASFVSRISIFSSHKIKLFTNQPPFPFRLRVPSDRPANFSSPPSNH